MCQISQASPGVQLFLPGVSETVSSQLPVSCLIDVFHFPDSGLEVLISNFFILSLGRDVFGSAEPALVLYAYTRWAQSIFHPRRSHRTCRL